MDKNLDKLTNALQKSKLKMDRSFSDAAEIRLKNFTLSNLEKERGSTNILLYLFSMRKRNIVALSFVAVISVLALTIVSATLIGQRSGSQQIYSKEETQRILAQIVKNNRNLGVLQNGISQPMQAGSSELSTQSDSDRKMAPNSASLPYYGYIRFDGFNYKYTKYENIFGPKFAECNPDDKFSNWNAISETYEYSTGSDADYFKNYKVKSKSLTPNNELTSYSLSYREGDYNVNYEYRGGDFAIKSLYEVGPETYDMISPLVKEGVVSEDSTSGTSSVAEQDLITQYFGTDAQITGTQNINGEDHYIVQVSYPFYCNNVENKLITQSVTNAVNFSIVSSKSYLNSISEGNLYSQNLQTLETRTISESEANQIFKFEYNVSIREKTYPYIAPEEYSAEREIEKSLNEVKKAGTKILMPVQGDLVLSYGYANQYGQDLSTESYYKNYTERTFYPRGALGDEMFQLYNYVPSTPVINYLSNWSYSSKGVNPNGFSINISRKDVTLNDLILAQTNEAYTTIKDKVVSTKNIRVDGRSIAATSVEYTIAYEEYKSEPGVDITSRDAVEGSGQSSPGYNPGTTNESKQSFLILEVDGFYYTIVRDYGNNTNLDLSSIEFQSYDLNNQSNYDLVKSLLLATMSNPIPIEPGIGDTPIPEPIACTMDAKICSDGSYVGRDPANGCEFMKCPE